MGREFVVTGFSQHEDGRKQSKVLKFTVPGEAFGKPTMSRRDKWKQRDCVVKYRAFADLVRLKSREAGMIPAAESVVELRITCYFLPPESHSAKERSRLNGTRHRVKPDSDNIAKSINDSLFKQDQAIADLVVRKRYDWEPRVEIEIEYE
jgi:Holliday junction resolvase RusA-like endonuclease